MKADISAKASDPLPPRLHFVGGKGGVGKTTCAAAFAVSAAYAGARVLVVSTDPAPSLGDALNVPLGPAPKRIHVPRGMLFAAEIDAPPVLRRWIADRRASLEKIVLEGTWLDQEDVDRLLTLSLPGMDEVAALLEISRFARTGGYDRIVVDTAPTGHTLRMLAMPETLLDIAGVFDRMWQKHRVIVEALRGDWIPEAEDRLIDEVAGEARSLAAMLRDRERTRFSWVTLPEPMAVAETLDAFATLDELEIAVGDVVVNRVTPPPATRCDHCEARRVFEAAAIGRLPRNRPTVHVSACGTEPRGLPALRRIAAELSAPPVSPAGHRNHASSTGRNRGGGTRRYAVTPHGRVAQGLGPASKDAGLRLLMFGGKGGVGKTTCAAAAAIAIAAETRSRRVLLISTDPAHSLADVLGVRLTGDPRPVAGAPANLAARELDAARVYDALRRRYAAAIDRAFDRMSSSSFDAAHDRAVMQALIELAPPGIDELAAIIEIADAVTGESPSWDLAVIDTAPTGHALRLLQLPSLIHDWTKALMSILLKYQPVMGLGDLASLLVLLSRGLGTLRQLLVDASRTHFVVVARGAGLPRDESVRLVRQLDKLRIHVPAVIVNAVGRGTCAACRKAAATERREIASVHRAVAAAKTRRQLILAGTQIPPPMGPAELRTWRRTWTF